MKNYLKTLFIFITLFSLNSCNEENNTEVDTTLNGIWNLVRIDGGLSQPVTYNKGEILWEVNLNGNTIKINNTLPYVGIQRSFSNNSSGTYNFSIENNLLIVGDRKGTIIQEENQLTIDYGIAFDDVKYTLIR